MEFKFKADGSSLNVYKNHYATPKHNIANFNTQEEAIVVAGKLNNALFEKQIDNFTLLKIEALKLAEELLELGLNFNTSSKKWGNGENIFSISVYENRNVYEDVSDKFLTRFEATENKTNHKDYLEQIIKFVEKRKENFFLIWSPTGTRPPKYKHYTLENAEAEAKRLASIYSGVFYVMECKGSQANINDGIPF